jgi:DNA-binding NarL/FixJ family response regulator
VDAATRPHSSERISVVLADDNPNLRAEVERSLGGEFDFLATVENGCALIEAWERFQPDVVVTDVSMPVMDGFEAVAELRRRGSPKVVFFTVHDEGALFDEARALGALGYVLKGSPPGILAKAIRAAKAGQSFVSPARTRER